MKRFKLQSIYIAILSFLFALPQNALARGTLTSQFSIDGALRGITEAFDSIETLIVVITYVIGVTLLIRGVMMYRIFANQTFGSAQRGEIAGPMVHLFVGALLIYVPSTLDTSLITIFGTASVKDTSDLINYSSLSGTEQWSALSGIIVKYMKLLGLIAFVRGWVILSKMGHSGSQPGSMGKGIMHVVGGVLLINGVETFNILSNTFGYTG